MHITFDEIGHTYTDTTGAIIPSVTQILGAVYGTGLEGAPKHFVDRAAEKGHSVHKEIETYLKNGQHGASEEFKTWHEWFCFAQREIVNYESEKIIYATTPKGAFAGTLDFYDGCIFDWKTCKTATRQQVKKWQKQLSFYCYAMRQMGYAVNEPLKILHVNGNDLEIINVDYLGDEFVEETMSLYKEIMAGTKTRKEAVLSQQAQLQTVTPNELDLLEETLYQMNELEEVVAGIREKIKNEMETRGILNLQVKRVKMTYVPGTVRTSFDSKSFKKSYAELYKQFVKDVEVKPSLRITVAE
jgi:hypothetical protein